MIQPLQDLRYARCFAPVRDRRPLHHHYRQSEGARCVQLCLGPGAPSVLRNHDVHAMPAHKRDIPAHIERAARDDHRVVRQRRRLDRRIDQPQDVMVLRLGREFGAVQSAQCQQDPLRGAGQCCDRRGHVRDGVPAIARARAPGRPGERQQRDPGLLGSLDGVAAHLRREWVRGVHEMGDVVLLQVSHQPRHAAEAADAYRDGLRLGLAHAPGIRQDRVLPSFGETAGQCAGLRGAPKEKDLAHG